MIEQLPTIIFNLLFFGIFVALLSGVVFIGIINFTVFTELMIQGGSLDPRWRLLTAFMIIFYIIYIKVKAEHEVIK